MGEIYNWLTMGANFAVLVGIVFVIIQINQGNASIRAAAYQTWVATNTELNMTLTNENLSRIIALGHANPEQLDKDNYVAYAMWVLSFMQMVQSTHYLHRKGAINKDLWNIEIQRAAAHLSFPGVRQWWNAGGKTQLSPGFVELVESTKLNITGWGWEEGHGFVPLEFN